MGISSTVERQTLTLITWGRHPHSLPNTSQYMIFKSIGKIIYNPRSHLGSNDKWAILACDDEIGRYYRYLYEKQYPYLNGGLAQKLTRPVWGSHISFIRGSEAFHLKSWKVDDNKIIEFEYDDGVIDSKEYFWLKVSCPYLLNLREQYGLSREPRYGLHLTIGRTTK